MTEKDKRKSGGAKLSRSETVTVRLDPKLRYLAELAGLKHRRTLSSFIEWAIEDTLGRIKLREGSGFGNDEGSTIADEAEHLWDVDESDRFAKLALRYPELLTHEEQKRWKLIRENGFLWRGNNRNPTKKWTWVIVESSLNYERLREHWPIFCAVSRGEVPKAKLPSWEGQQDNGPAPSADASLEDNDIPF